MQLHAIIMYMYSKCNVKPVWFEVRQQNFVVCELKFTNFSAFDVELIVVVNAVFRLSMSLSILEIYAIKLYSCLRMGELTMLGRSK